MPHAGWPRNRPPQRQSGGAIGEVPGPGRRFPPSWPLQGGASRWGSGGAEGSGCLGPGDLRDPDQQVHRVPQDQGQ
eukprot:2836799-Alexandrium_andersonii.AAC.1